MTARADSWLAYLKIIGGSDEVSLYRHTATHYQLDIENWVLFDIWIPVKSWKPPKYRVNTANISAKPQPLIGRNYANCDFEEFKKAVQTAISTRRLRDY